MQERGDDYVVVSGGALPPGKVVPLKITQCTHRGQNMRMCKIGQNNNDLCKLLTGGAYGLRQLKDNIALKELHDAIDKVGLVSEPAGF